MNLAGILVQAQPEQVSEVKNRLTALSGVEVHAMTPDGRLVVTVEEEQESIFADRVLELHHCEGVISATLVYQYSNDNEDFDEDILI